MQLPAKTSNIEQAAPDDERTVFQPAGSAPALPTEEVPAPSVGRTGLPPGSLLNNIYQVKRFLARGGMGEVYEGVNVNTDERVAIKVMLPHLAADPKVQAMFRKEARILTELAHPALVRYRVLAHEPQLEVFYIVTEFIDGPSLSERLGALRPDAEALAALMRRLAGGLAAAHAHGAVHRDISPDNVLLPDGRLELAKIIDFGIAREGSLAHHTVVGDGFAGKLGYVAPEQLGDFGARIGPWTDVYSLGLVGLTLAAGRSPNLGATLVDAVDRRREAVDLRPLPASLRPVFEKMLAPDPAHRLQSMEAVIAAFEGRKPASAAAPEPVAPAPRRARLHPAVIAGGAVAAVAVLAVVVGGAPKKKAGPLDTVLPIEQSTQAAPAPTAAPAAAQPVAAAPVETPTTAPATEPAPRTAKSAPAAPAAAREPVQVAQTAPAAPHVPAGAETPAATPTTAAQEAGEAAPAGQTEACWRADGGDWTYIGYASRGSCAAQVFASCPVVHGRWGKTQLRRYDGKLQAKGTGVLAKWRTVGTSECASSATSP